MRYRHVLVPLDGSRFAAAALRTAQALAARFGAELHAVSVAEHDDEVDVMGREAAAALGPGAGPEQVHVVVGDNAAATPPTGPALISMSTRGRGRITARSWIEAKSPLPPPAAARRRPGVGPSRPPSGGTPSRSGGRRA